MKNKSKIQIMTLVLITLVFAVAYLLSNPKVVTQTQFVAQGRREMPARPPAPEFRGPPLRPYKPGMFHQMGLLTSDSGETLPLYGKEVNNRRDRFNFYTTTGTDNLYPVPLNHKDRDCMDDVGCGELYGNEAVSVTGKTDPFTVNMYRTDNFNYY
mgnify:FL=1